MEVKFVNTTSSKLSSVSVVNGQLIALSDKPSISYDLGGVRKTLSLSDSYTESAGTAASGVAASSYALVTAYTALKNNLNVMFPNSLLLRGWLTMGMLRGDSTWITLFVPGARVAVNGASLICSSSSVTVHGYHPTNGWTALTLNNPTWTQVETGVRCIAAQSGVGWGGVFTFNNDLTLTPNY